MLLFDKINILSTTSHLIEVKDDQESICTTELHLGLKLLISGIFDIVDVQVVRVGGGSGESVYWDCDR